VSGALQADPAMHGFVVDQAEPVIEWQSDNSLVDDVQVARDLPGVVCKFNFQEIFHDQWQQMGTGLTAQYRPFVTGCQQLWNTPDMVIVYVADQQRPDSLGIESE